MTKCSCCKKEKSDAHGYSLPPIGYGSQFDCVTENDIVKFNLCTDCAKKINRWIHKKAPTLDLKKFWDCNIIIEPDEKHPEIYYEYFEYEDLLMDVFKKFMPQKIYGDNYHLPRLLDKFLRL